VHRFSTVHGCTCEAGRKGQVCWHAMLIEIIEQAQMRAIPMSVKIAAARATSHARAMTEIDELYSN
jgi:hypothetical protein